MLSTDTFFVATTARDAETCARQYGVGYEILTFSTAARMDPPDFPKWDQATATLLASSSAKSHLWHAPFSELCPAAIDPLARALTRNRLLQAVVLARGYGVRRIVVHGGFIPGLYQPEWFAIESIRFFADLLDDIPGDTHLMLKNVLEDDPGMLRRIVEGVGDARLRLCLDLGHAGRHSQVPSDQWIAICAPYLAHVRVQNNDADAQGGWTEGMPSLDDAMALIRRHAPDATITLDMEQALPSLARVMGEHKAEAPPPADDVIMQTLKRVFGYDGFRTGQRALIDAQLAGHDALGVMPTGSGKSLSFQLPALLMDGVTLVISPLISLMQDQVAALRQAGVGAAYLNSSLTERQFGRALQNAADGHYKLIYIAPERLLTPRFLSFSQGIRIGLVAVDEAHCISQWGQDFRPSYLDIPRYLEALPTRPVVSAFTATATEAVKKDIVRLLALQSPTLVQTGFDRPNLYYSVLRPKKKQATLLSLLSQYSGQSGIIYCATRKNVEAICELLRGRGIPATRYHAGLSDGERTENQHAFTHDQAPVIVATNAFGMGIDKSNVRFIIHYNMPKDLESYYQEAGRAGRDGERADCVLLYSSKDEQLQRFLIEKDDEESAQTDPALRRRVQHTALKRLATMIQYCKTQQCLRQAILSYFGERLGTPCGNCGNCASTAVATDMTQIALPLLQCVRSTGERFGLGTIVELARGANTRRLRDFSLDTSPCFGILSGKPSDLLKAVGDQLVSEGYLQIREGKLPVVRLGPMAQDALSEKAPIFLRLPQESPAPAPSRMRGDPSAAPADAALFEALRTLRLRLATQRGIAAYMIFSDATLRELSAAQPVTREAMLPIRGIGETKLAQYGDAFLDVIRQYREQNAD